MITLNNSSSNSSLLIFKFNNFDLDYPEDIKEILKFSTNNGDFNEIEIINTLGKTDYKKIIILGIGDTEEFNSLKLNTSLGSTILNLKTSIDNLDILDNLTEDFGYAIGETLSISLYKYSGIKSIENNVKLKNINIISPYEESIRTGILVGNNINLGRNLINLPSNIATPKYISQQAEFIAKEENLDIEIFDKYQLEQIGMNGIIYVGKGSNNNARLVVMQYFGDPDSKDIVALIGKGVTFDSGGISLKGSKNMENMISDMAGAATVLSVIKTISNIKPKKNVLALIPLVENMPSGSSYKPGDVITTYSGKTVQIISTDAEGRLILCDAISYAKELGATKIIDIATLTGSCSNFLGNINMAILSNSDTLASNIIKCGKDIGENLWRLPNNEEYLEMLKTDAADLKNTGGSCGAIVAGLFLQSFAEDVEFAHIDIAGSAVYSQKTNFYDVGANARPARTLIKYITK